MNICTGNYQTANFTLIKSSLHRKKCAQIKKGFMLTMQDARSIHDSMNIPKIEFIAY